MSNQPKRQHTLDSALRTATLNTIFSWVNSADGKPVPIMLAELNSNVIDAVINTGYIVTNIKTDYQQEMFMAAVKLKRRVGKKWQRNKWEIHIPLTNNFGTCITTHDLGQGAANHD